MTTETRVITGPPGTGKTRALIQGVGSHLARNPASKRVLLCSHTKAAAIEAFSRFNALQAASSVAIQTLHSFCFQQMKIGRDQTVDEKKLSSILEDWGLDPQEGGDGGQYLEMIGRARSLMVNPLDLHQASMRAPGSFKHFSAFVESYERWKREFGYVDFPDMLELYATKAESGTGLTQLSIDEAQDLSPLHWTVIHRIMALNPHAQVTVAGDEDQCIYQYNGADPSGMRNFGKLYRSEVHDLDQSYRVPRTVHGIARKIIRRAIDRRDVQYKPRDAEGHVESWADVGQLPRNIGTGRDTLVLYADKFIRETVEQPLLDAHIPYHVVGGMPGPLDTKAGKALTECFKVRPDENRVRPGLSTYGVDVWNMAGPEAVVERLRKRDMQLLRVAYSHVDYLNSVDLLAPRHIRLSTIHGAKGAEATDVHLVLGQSQGAADYAQVMPDAAHRLFYVAVTRAKERLFLYEGEQNGYEVPQ